LGLVNTVVAVLGEENVVVRLSGQRYGGQNARPLEAMFDDFPPVPGELYLVAGIDARIDPEVAMTWEMPVRKSTQALPKLDTIASLAKSAAL
jgi:hypothetical protein